MQTTLAWQMEGRLIVAVHTRENPSRLEWTRFINGTALARPTQTEGRVLVVSYGGSPDAAQRKELADAVKHPFPTVIMTSSVMLRSLGAALAFFNRRVKVVGIEEHDQAVRYLELTPAESVTVRQIRFALERRLEIRVSE